MYPPRWPEEHVTITASCPDLRAHGATVEAHRPQKTQISTGKDRGALVQRLEGSVSATREARNLN